MIGAVMPACSAIWPTLVAAYPCRANATVAEAMIWARRRSRSNNGAMPVLYQPERLSWGRSNLPIAMSCEPGAFPAQRIVRCESTPALRLCQQRRNCGATDTYPDQRTTTVRVNFSGLKSPSWQEEPCIALIVTVPLCRAVNWVQEVPSLLPTRTACSMSLPDATGTEVAVQVWPLRVTRIVWPIDRSTCLPSSAQPMLTCGLGLVSAAAAPHPASPATRVRPARMPVALFIRPGPPVACRPRFLPG